MSVKAPRCEYPAVEAWGHFMHSDPAYIALQVMDACNEGAPKLAAYKYRGRWVTLQEFDAPAAIHFFRQHYPDLAQQAWGDET